MLPFIFEWAWDMPHIVFMGALGYALNIIGIGLTYCIIMATIDTLKGKSESDEHH